MIKKFFIVLCFSLVIINFVFAQGSIYQEPGASVLNGKTTVTTAGIAVPLSTSSTSVLSINIGWLQGNIGNKVYVGTKNVNANNGFQLASGAILKLEVSNVNAVYINADIATDGVSWIAVQR